MAQLASSSAANEDGFFRNQSNTILGSVGIALATAMPLKATPMSDITRAELDAKLELIETRMDGRLKDIHHHIETLLDVNNKLVSQSTESRKDFRNWGVGILIALFTTVIAVLIGVWQIVVGVSQSNIAWFESGRNAGTQQPAAPMQKHDQKK